ncbi:hypothetical protein MASR2M16_05690 [Thauera terpenica]
MKRLPAQGALLTQDGRGAEGVTTVQRDGVIEDVKNAHQMASGPPANAVSEIDYKLPATRRLAAALARSRLADGMNLNQVDQGNFARRRAQARAGATDSGAGFTAPSRLRRKASNINSDHKGAL